MAVVGKMLAIGPAFQALRENQPPLTWACARVARFSPGYHRAGLWPFPSIGVSYGDPTPPKRGLARKQLGDLLVEL